MSKNLSYTLFMPALIFYGGNHEAFQVVTSEKAFWALLADMAS